MASPVQHDFDDIELSVVDGGVLAPDYPPDRIKPTDYTVKDNFRYSDGAEEDREGWDDYRPNTGVAASTSRVMGTAIKQVGEARRANGETVPVGVSAGKIYYWNWSDGEWKEIGTGYSTTVATRWQIENVGSYVVFNNGTDLPCTWVIGDASVTPIYEFREQGYVCAGTMTESNGMLLLEDITEILPDKLSSVLNGGTPYGTVSSANTQHYGFRKVWSNINNPRDFAAVVTGSGSAGSPNITLAWPMASFEVGDEITIIGGGTAGGNLTTTIKSISGTALELDTNLVTAISDAAIQKTTALNSVVGYLDLEDDGSIILRSLPLQNRVVTYKSSGEIFVGYYTGDLDQPWAYDRVYSPTGENRGVRFPHTLIDIGGKYHLYAGAKHFYMFSLGSREPERHPVLRHCERTLFFDPIAAATTDYTTIRNVVFAAKNGCTNEVFFKVPHSTPANSHALVYDFENEKASRVTGFVFDCAATIRKPIAAKASDEQEVIFIMGWTDGTTGKVATYGRSNLNLITLNRFGSGFTRTLETGLISFGHPNKYKRVVRYGINCNLANSAISVTLYKTNAPQISPTSVFTKSNLNASGQVTIVGLLEQACYFKEKIERVSPSSAMRISSRVWRVAVIPGEIVSRTVA